MVKITKEYIFEIINFLKKRKFAAAFSRFLLPLILLLNFILYELKFRLIMIKNKKGEIIVKINDLYKMQLNLNDKGICRELCVHKKREFFSTDFFKVIIKNGMNIIDIGSNIGYYALLESRLISEGHVYAIEPVPENFYLLNKNIRINNFKNITTFNFAIGDLNGSIEMFIYDRCNWSSVKPNPEGSLLKTIKVPIVTLDKFLELYSIRNPHFIRMDVEGYEFNILKGAQKTLKNVKPLIICIEMHPHLMSENETKECLNLLKSNGFNVKTIVRETLCCDYNTIFIINKLRGVLNLSPFGFYGNDYESLENLLNNRQGAIVYFEKK